MYVFFQICTKNGFIICRSLKVTLLCMRISLSLNWPVETDFCSCCGCCSLAQGRCGQTSAPNKTFFSLHQVKSWTPSFDKAEDGSDYPLVHFVVKGRGSNHQDFGWFTLPAKADIPRHGYARNATKLIFSMRTCTIKRIHKQDLPKNHTAYVVGTSCVPWSSWVLVVVTMQWTWIQFMGEKTPK